MDANTKRAEENRYKLVSNTPFLHNAPIKRPEGMPYITWWKNRRNAQLAFKARMRMGVNATVMIDTKTMSIETDRARSYRNQKEIDNYGR